MEENFYKNPISVIWKAKNNLMPSYLIIIWISLFSGSIIGVFWLDFIDFSSFKMGEYFSISTTGLTLTLALFVAGKDAFSDEDLKKLAGYESDEVKKGQALIDFIGPYIFTALLFLITGLISLFGPFVKTQLDPLYIKLFKICYINLLSFGILSLFNLVIIMLNDVFSAAFRK